MSDTPTPPDPATQNFDPPPVELPPDLPELDCQQRLAVLILERNAAQAELAQLQAADTAADAITAMMGRLQERVDAAEAETAAATAAFVAREAALTAEHTADTADLRATITELQGNVADLQERLAAAVTPPAAP